MLLANGSITNQRMPTLSGTGEPGAIITLYNNGAVLDTVESIHRVAGPIR